MPTAYVQVPAFHEGFAYGETLRAIRELDPPEGWTVEREVHVTPSCDNLDTCRTWVTARETDGWEPVKAPVGKLSTRNQAHDRAFGRGADAVVTWDADAPPRSENPLKAILRPLERPEVVAANGTPVAPLSLAGVVQEAVSRLDDVARPHFHGQLSAITREGWQHAGPFDEDIDQFDPDAVRQEEEFDFYHRLQEVGEVVDVPEARVLNSDRRVACRVSDSRLGGGAPTDYCERRGTVSFFPRGRR